MFRLDAPVPAINVTVILPNPRLSDVESRNQQIDKKRSMNNTLYTYCTDEGTGKLTYTWTLTRDKSLELQAFVQEFFADKVRITNHKGEVWEVYFDGNPFEIQQAGRQAGVFREHHSVTITFEGVRVS